MNSELGAKSKAIRISRVTQLIETHNDGGTGNRTDLLGLDSTDLDINLGGHFCHQMSRDKCKPCLIILRAHGTARENC